MLKRGGGVFQRDTVDAQRDNLRIIRQSGNHFTQRRAVAEVFAVTQGKREPRARTGILTQQRRQGFDLCK
ncbi:hypothetical protein D3C78_1917280 [compost metagenome]